MTIFVTCHIKDFPQLQLYIEEFTLLQLGLCTQHTNHTIWCGWWWLFKRL